MTLASRLRRLRRWILRIPVSTGSYTVINEEDYTDTVLSEHNPRIGDNLQINCGGPATATNGKRVTSLRKRWNGKKWVRT